MISRRVVSFRHRGGSRPPFGGGAGKRVNG